MPTDAGIEPRTVATGALAWQSDALTTRLDLIRGFNSNPGFGSGSVSKRRYGSGSSQHRAKVVRKVDIYPTVL